MPEVHNPNLQSQGSGGGGGDMRSTMAFMLIVVAAFLGYQYFFAKPKPEQQQPAAQLKRSQSLPAAPASQGPARPTAAGQSAAAAAAAKRRATPQIAAALDTTTTVENEFYKIVFTNRGAQVKHWILKKYFDSARQASRSGAAEAAAAASSGLPLSLFTYDPALTTQLNQALYQVSISGAQPTATGLVLAPDSITFHYAANGARCRKNIPL